MMKDIISFALFAVLVTPGSCYELRADIPDHLVPGTCPQVNEEELWELQKPRYFQLAGKWFQQAVTPNKFQPMERCVETQYNWDGEGFHMRSTGLRGTEVVATEGRVYPQPHGKPSLEITHQHAFPAPLLLLETDFLNYACMYSCLELGGGFKTDLAFVYSRQREMHPAYMRICESAYGKIGFDLGRLFKTSQGEDCSNATLVSA
ncbi:crustacyanin-C1 subunit-like [Palaemon carinicauda]|uniref:crustacyanin-C1 subunit-like n=1 Tax=Palaemon carinicauda TaxID=392227 RepID=UPI0035B5A162